MNPCPAMPAAADTGLANVLASLDCQLNAAVATGYGRLFGHSGAFAATLTVVLTLYVALLALGLIGGRARLSLSAMLPKVLTLGLVLTFATAWPAYQTVVFDLLSRGPDQIASAFVGRGAGATQAFVLRLDDLIGRYMDMAQALQPRGQQASPNLQMAAKLAWAGSLLLTLSTAGLLVAVRVVLAILLALGPVFIVFALFRSTRGLFEGWLKTVLAFALAPLLIVLGGAGAIALMSPLLDEVLRDPSAAGEALRPVALLFVAAVVYVCILLALLWTAINLTRNWRLPHSAASAASGASGEGGAGNARGHAPGPARGTHREHAAAGDAATRLSAVSAALARDRTTVPSSRSLPVPVSVAARGEGSRDDAGNGRRGQSLSRWGRSRGNRGPAAAALPAGSNLQ